MSVEKYLQLRLLIGYLGESAQYHWWNTAFFLSSSKTFLEPIFARTSFLARYHGVTNAARALHDDRIGVGDVTHLFRLPEEMERALHQLVENQAGADTWINQLASKELALQALSDLAGQSQTTSAPSAHEGPISVGKAGDLLTGKVMKEMARCYLSAFEQNIRTYPYLLGHRERE
jgi:hypothetical protein